MMPQTKTQRTILFLLTTIAFILACAVSVGPATSSPPAFDSTKAALELQNTAIALKLTQAVPNPAQSSPIPPAPTNAPPPLPVTVSETPASQVPPDIQKLVDDYSQKGYLPSTEGEYHHLEDFSMDFANASLTYAKRETGYEVKDFMVKAHFKWQSAIANPDPGGCGWAFRKMKNDTYLAFIDRDWIYLGMMNSNQWTRYGKTSGNAWVGLGNPAEADVALTVSKGKAYVIINDAFASSYTLDTDYLTSSGELDYIVVAGTYKDYGTRCKMTNVDLWISNP
jgi:hypothetical protein